MGLFGIVTVTKYWERFMFHTHQERAFRAFLDAYFPPSATDTKENGSILEIQVRETAVMPTEGQQRRVLIGLREAAKKAHNQEWCKLWSGVFTDGRVMQHYLWIFAFWFVTMIGVTRLLMPHIGWLVAIWVVATIILILWIRGIRSASVSLETEKEAEGVTGRIARARVHYAKVDEQSVATERSTAG